VIEETAGPPPLRPLPIRPRPASGEATASYIRRLAVANHLRPVHLRRYLKDPGHGGIRLSWLAVLASRPVTSLQYALADQQLPSGEGVRNRQPGARQPRQSRTELFMLIRRDAREHGLSARALADRHGTGARTVRQALRSPQPSPRKPLPPRRSRLDPFTAIIDGMLQAEEGSSPARRQSIVSIHHELVTRHAADGISYQMVRAYVSHRRAIRPPLSPAHTAVLDHDLTHLRDLLDNGHDLEDDNGDGWTLLRRAIHAEHARHTRAGEPLHADLTALLLARGADPQATHNSTPAEAEAELLGHWLAAEIIRAWTKRPAQGQETQHPTT
jgi:hypothetical protein